MEKVKVGEGAKCEAKIKAEFFAGGDFTAEIETVEQKAIELLKDPDPKSPPTLTADQQLARTCVIDFIYSIIPENRLSFRDDVQILHKDKCKDTIPANQGICLYDRYICKPGFYEFNCKKKLCPGSMCLYDF